MINKEQTKTDIKQQKRFVESVNAEATISANKTVQIKCEKFAEIILARRAKIILNIMDRFEKTVIFISKCFVDVT